MCHDGREAGKVFLEAAREVVDGGRRVRRRRVLRGGGLRRAGVLRGGMLRGGGVLRGR